MATQYIQDQRGYKEKAKLWVQEYAQENYKTDKEKLVVSDERGERLD